MKSSYGTSKDTVIAGTELKFNINIEPIDGITMSEYDFNAEFFTSAKSKLSVSKEDMIKIDDSNYVALVDTDIFEKGMLYMQLTAYIPDADFPDGLRTEVYRQSTGFVILQRMYDVY